MSHHSPRQWGRDLHSDLGGKTRRPPRERTLFAYCFLPPRLWQGSPPGAQPTLPLLPGRHRAAFYADTRRRAPHPQGRTERLISPGCVVVVVDLPTNRGSLMLPWPRDARSTAFGPTGRAGCYRGGATLLAIHENDGCVRVVDQRGWHGWISASALRHLSAPCSPPDTYSPYLFPFLGPCETTDGLAPTF